MATSTTSTKTAVAFTLPLTYTLFFLAIEPICTLIGAIYGIFFPQTYLHLLSTSISSPAPMLTTLSPQTSTILAQLGNLYLLLALLEASILRSTSDLKVWSTLLVCMLIADIGHVASCYLSMDAAVGLNGFWKFWLWNRLDWGNLGFVYVAAGLRIAFLRDVGLGRANEAGKKVGKKA